MTAGQTKQFAKVTACPLLHCEVMKLESFTMMAPTTLMWLIAVLIDVALGVPPQTAEEMRERLSAQFQRAATLHHIHLSNISYDQLDTADILGPDVVETYDFVIVGGGTSGAVLANRLSEISEYSVLLLEAGDVGDFMTDIPALAGLSQFGQYNWGYLTEVQENMGLGLKDQRMLWSTGKGLGGTTLIDYMGYSRGNKIDYDIWEAMGNPGWSYDELLQYFKKSEDSKVELEDFPYRNQGGELTVDDIPYRSQSVDTFVEACKSLGYPYVDYNGATQIGVSYFQATERNGLRCSGEKAFLRPAMYRSNLVIRTNTMVTKVLVDEENVAYGVEFVRKGFKYTVKAQKEVILSAGPYNSAQLLMLSGIGPRKHLKSLGIHVKKDLPVGENLHDYIMYLGLAYKLNQDIGVNVSAWSDSASFLELYKYGRGPLTSMGGLEALAYVRTDVSTNPWPTYPDVEFLYFGLGLNSDNGVVLSKFFRVSDKVYDAMFKPLEGHCVVSPMPLLVHPKSHGYMKLRSANPFDAPKLYGNYFTDPTGVDLKTMIAGIREIQRIFATPAFQKYGAEQVKTPVPGCEAFTFDSDPYLECALRSISVSLYHSVGACKMGPLSDPEAVVDARLRVYGIRNLRVVDSSVIPKPLAGHAAAPSYMVGEKGADIIKQDWAY